MTKQLKFSYTITGVMDTNGMGEADAIKDLRSNLDDITGMLVNGGLLTDYTDMTVSSYGAVGSVEAVNAE